jgi:hypothetical protein
MKNDHLQKELASFATLQPRKEFLATLRARVFKLVDATAPTRAHAPRARVSPFLRFMLPMGLAFALLLVVSNQLPMYGAYNTAIDTVAEASVAADILGQKGDIASVQKARTTMEKARSALNSLNLKGEFGIYTQEHCFQAYMLYDSYLDYVIDYVDANPSSDTDTQNALADLRAYAEESLEEAKVRIDLYPAGMK